MTIFKSEALRLSCSDIKFKKIEIITLKKACQFEIIINNSEKMMNSPVLFKTKSQALYAYDFRANSIFLCHPILNHILELYLKGVDLEAWIRNLPDKKISIVNYGTCSHQQIKYYYKEFLMLKENGYFSSFEEEFSGRLNADNIRSNQANLSQVVFEVTDSCNLNCAYCSYGELYKDYDKRENINLSITTAKNILNYFFEFWNSSFNTSHGTDITVGFYGGEPLVSMPFIKEIVEYAKGLKLLRNRFSFAMTTNGVLLEKYMDFIAENEFILLISLDGNQKNNSYRTFKNGKPAYEHIFKSVMALKNKYPEYFEKHVSFNAVLHNRNSVSEIYHYFKETMGKIPRISALSTLSIADSKKEVFWNTYRNPDQSWRQSKECELILEDMFLNLPRGNTTAKFVHRFSGSVYRDYNHLLNPCEDQLDIPSGTCMPFSRKVFITVHGKILPCERVPQKYTLGYADENGVQIDFETVAQNYNNYYDKLKQQCSACYISGMCPSCMFHLNIDDEKVNCDGFMDDKAFSKYLASCMSHLEQDPGKYFFVTKGVVFK